MTHRGPDFYDDKAVFATYTQRRQQPDNPNDTLEKPILWELLGDVQGKRILDLGCGDAAIALELLNKGCQSYLGVEGSANMVAAAQQTLQGTATEVVHADLTQWTVPHEAFDLVLSRLVLHYLPSLKELFHQVHQGLTAGGRFIFSVEHPVITSSDVGWRGQGERQAWLVDDYFDTGPRLVSWMGSEVTKYHRTVEDYFTALQHAGFRVEQLRESRPQRSHISDETLYQRRQRIPLFLFLASSK